MFRGSLMKKRKKNSSKGSLNYSSLTINHRESSIFEKKLRNKKLKKIGKKIKQRRIM